MNASTAYVAKMLRGLEEREMIRRRPDDQDRRRTLITLTKAGESAAQKDMDFVRAISSRCWKHWEKKMHSIFSAFSKN